MSDTSKKILIGVLITLILTLTVVFAIIWKLGILEKKPEEYTIQNASEFEENSSANYFDDVDKVMTLDDWKEVNSDVVYLLKINGKEFPVSFGKTHDYYLTHDVWGNYDVFGSVSLDENSTVDTENKIIYGHSTYTKDLLFTFIPNYKNKDYYEENKTFVLEDATGEHNYIVLALMYIPDGSSPENMDWFKPDVHNIDSGEYARTFIKDAEYVYSDVVKPGKGFIELCTCEMKNTVEDSIGRYVLLAQEL